MRNKKLVIGVDAGCLGVKDVRLKVGVYTVALNALVQLAKIDKKNTYCLYSFKKIDRSTLKRFGKNFHNVVVTPTKGWASIWLPLKIRKDNLDIFLGLNQFLPRLEVDIYKIGFIYDLAFFEYPEFYPGSLKKLQNITESLARRADTIVTVSEAVKNDIQRRYSIDAPITVLHPGVITNTVKKNRKNQFLFVGALKRGKNVPNIIKAFDQFHKTSNNNFELVIVGGDKWLDPSIDKAMSQISLETKKKIQFKGFVSEKELSDLYNTSYAFVSPSFYEGFGLTHVEAMSHSLPIIAARAGSQEEIVGNAGIFVNPHSSKSICEAMHALATDKVKYKELSLAAREISKIYNWNAFGNGLYEIIARHEKEKSRNSKGKVPQQV